MTMTYILTALTNDRAQLILFTAQTTDEMIKELTVKSWEARGYLVKVTVSE